MNRRVPLAVAGSIAAVFLALQFVPVERSNPPATTALTAPPEVAALLERACYDCHSHATKWPWYSRLAPVSFWVVRHVEDGRRHLNFSRWPILDPEAQEHLLRDIGREVEEGEMPLRSYTFGHPEARLTDEERGRIIAWARSGS